MAIGCDVHLPELEATQSCSPSAPGIEPRGNEAFLQLLSASFMLDITNHSVLTRNLRFIERLFDKVAIRRLRIPNGFSSLPKVRETVLKDIDALGFDAALSAR